MSKSLFGCRSLASLLLLANLAGSLMAQWVANPEPPGPSSRRTGLVLTEIHYHPRPVEGLTNRAQFVEIYNSKPWTEDLSGFFIDGSVRFTFPSNTLVEAKSYLVVARDPEFIRTNYGITNVVGPWDGALTNGLSIDAGTVRVRNRVGAVLLQTDYSDAPPWPASPDGWGHSLVLVKPSYGENDYRAWGQSDVAGGSPGQADQQGPEPLASVFINEWMSHTDLPLRDSIELYNHSNADVDLSGAYLSDSPDTNGYRIPDGTVLPARGFRVFDDSVLGFSLFAGGETIFLINSNLTRVIDAVNFKGMSNAVSAGRYPDGGPLNYTLSSRTLGGPNSPPKRWPVVINEIMYNPISGDANDDYVEIYNRSGAPFNIGAWAFTNGIVYQFSNNTIMPAGAYWVVARNPSNLFSIYNNLGPSNTFGPYTGTLANGGERLALSAADYDNVLVNGQMVTERLNVIASEVIYGDGGRWGNWSDGGGASLELIDPEADTFLPGNWADSDDTGESVWTAIEYNGPLGETLGVPVNDSLIILMQGIGECLIDEVEVRVIGGANLVANGGFESGLDGWTLQGSHDLSSVETVGFAGSRSLHIRAGSRGDNQSNRILSQPFAQSLPANALVSIRAKVKWLRGHPEILLRLHGGGAEAFGTMALPKKLGTPGQPNSRRVPNAGPAIYDVAHAPLLPAANEPVVVTARASDRQGVAALTLRYRVDPDPAYMDVPMLDDGTAGDAIAHDGIYSGTIPGQGAGVMTPFYVSGRDGSGALSQFPADVFPPAGLERCWPNDALTRECLVRWGEPQMPGDFPTYHLWVSSVNSNRWHHRAAMNNTAVDGTFVYNNSRAIYNALPLFSGSPWHRTNSSAGPAGPNRVDYEMNFPADDALFGSEDFILNNPGNADQLTISDLSAVGEQTVYRIMEGIGLVQNHRRYVHVFVNGNQRSTTPQRPGNFIFEDSQQPSGDMIDQWFPNDPGGQLFKVEDWFEFHPNGFDIEFNNDADLTRRTIEIDGQPVLNLAPYRFMFRKRSIGVGNSANDYSQIFALIDAVSPRDNPDSPTVDVAAVSSIADWEQWMRVFAVQRTVGNWDSYGWNRGKNDYWYRGATSGFVHMTWDIDYSMGLGRPWNEPLFESNDPRVAAMFNTPEMVRGYWRAFQDILDGPFRNEVLDPFIDARVNALLGNGVNIDLDAVAGIKQYITQRRGFIEQQLAAVNVPFAILEPPTYFPTNSLVVITGSAPVSVRQVLVNGTNYPVTWLNATSFAVRVILPPGANDFYITGHDRAGALLPGASQLITFDYQGSAPEPRGALVFSEILYRPASVDSQFLELLNRSPDNFDLSGWRLDGVGFTFPLGTLIASGERLLLVRNREAFRAVYGNVPVTGVFNADLSAQGQSLALYQPSPTGPVLVSSIEYEARAPWPPTTNGVSLQLIDSTQDNRRAANWAADFGAQATPGRLNSSDAILPAFASLWLNEVQIENLTGTVDNQGEPEPWIELFNAGTNLLNLDGYFLSDNFSNLTSWAFPAGTALEPGERRVIWADGEALESEGTNLHTNFRLLGSGQVVISRGQENQATVVDHLSWASLGPNLSAGFVPEGALGLRSTMPLATPGAINVPRGFAVSINEWLARNSINITDPADGVHDDWFELYNAGSVAIDLGGYYLTDNLTNPTKNRIPTNGQYRVAPGGTLLVWADNATSQNRADRADLHVNFQLGGASGAIGLFAPDGLTQLDGVTYGEQTNDVSEGRFSDGAATRYFMAQPTPRNLNSLHPLYNSAPYFAAPTNQFISPGQLMSYSFRARDVDRPPQTLTYTLLSGPAGMTLINNGTFRWQVPTNQPFGEYLVVGSVTDSGVPPKSESTTFLVTVRSTNVVPVIPNVVQPVIRQFIRPEGQSSLSFSSVAGRTYRVWFKDDLSSPTWTQLDRDFVAGGTLISITDLNPAQQRFYRVQQLD